MKNSLWRSLIISLLVYGIVFSLMAPPLLEAQTKPATNSPTTRSANDFAPGDGVRIKTWREITVVGQGDVNNLGLNDDFIIDNRGTMTLPVLGEFRTVGHTRKSLARAIEDSLGIRGIRVMCSPLIRLIVLGAVNKPGAYLIEPKDSIWGLINIAGGPANGADVKGIHVERSNQIVADNLLEGFQQAYSLEQIGVRSGDQVYLPGVKHFNWRAIVDYATLTASFVVLYYQIQDRRPR